MKERKKKRSCSLELDFRILAYFPLYFECVQRLCNNYIGIGFGCIALFAFRSHRTWIPCNCIWRNGMEEQKMKKKEKIREKC